MAKALNDLVLFADAWDMHDGGGGWWVVMTGGLGERSGGRAKGAIDLLDERLATGDISIEDYERRREILAGGRSSTHP